MSGSIAALVEGGRTEPGVFIDSLSILWQHAGVMSKADTAILFIPGFYGSRLINEKTKASVWIDAREALLGSHSLRLPVSTGDPALPLVSAGVLERVRVVPGIYTIDVYGGLLQTLRGEFSGKAEIIPFDYDWRLSPAHAIEKLADKVENLQNQGFREIRFIAHSFGGLIASYYLRYGTQEPGRAKENWFGAERVGRVIFAGVPFRGVMSVFRNMQHGVKVAWNSSLLDRDSYGSLQGAYLLLPYAEEDCLIDENGHGISGEIRDPREWKTKEWGFLKGSSHPSACLAYIETWLDKANDYTSRIHADARSPLPSSFRSVNIIGKGRPTLARGLRKNGRIGFYPADLKEMAPGFLPSRLDAEGDGTVTLASARLPAAFQTQSLGYESPRDHLEILTAPEMKQKLIEYLGCP